MITAQHLLRQTLRAAVASIPPCSRRSGGNIMGRHILWGIPGGPIYGGFALTVALAALPGIASAQGLAHEPRIIGRAIDFATRTIGDGTDTKNGVYVELSNLPTGSGWISAGPGYRQWLFDDRAFVEASTAVSWRAYKMAQARFEFPHLIRSRLAIGSQVRWQDLTQVTYFGEGPDSLDTDRSEYRLKSSNISGHAIVYARQWLSIGGRLGWLDRPSVLQPSGTFERGNPATEDVFPNDPVFALAAQPSFAYGETWFTADTRDQRGHPTRGGVYRAAWVHYTDRDGGNFGFDRAETEAAHFVPLLQSRLVLAVHGWFVATGTNEGGTVPFYLASTLGGHNTIRAYTDYRFHDRNLLMLNLESRLALMRHIDVVLFADAGNVAPRVADLNIDKRAYGFGIRLHAQKSTFARIDLAHGAEGWNLLFRMNDPLHLNRLVRRTAAIPFVP